LPKVQQLPPQPDEKFPAPWDKPGVTAANALLTPMAATAMFLIAAAAAFIPSLDMPSYVPFAIAQGIWGWSGYLISRLCHWESPFPSGGRYKPMNWTNTLLTAVIGWAAIFGIQFIINFAAQLTANTFVIAAYIILAAVCESQFFHISFIDVGASLGYLAAESKVGMAIGKAIGIVPGVILFIAQFVFILPAVWVFTVVHVEYQGNFLAILSVVLCGLLLCIMYAITGNADAVIWTHILWNLILVLKL
jgi:hypothetical protein